MINIETLNDEISEFKGKYDRYRFDNPDKNRAYTEEADDILRRYEALEDSESEQRRALAKFCSHLGCMVTVFGQDLEKGVEYYHRSVKLDPHSYDIRWEYYTTLEEIVEDKEYSTPELVQDAVDCLNFCIDYCDTPQLKAEHYIHFRYTDLGRVYMAAGDYRKAKECFKKSMEILPNDNAERLLKQVNKKIGNPVSRFFNKLFSFFRKNK